MILKNRSKFTRDRPTKPYVMFFGNYFLPRPILATIGTTGMAMVFKGCQPLVKRWNGNDPSLWSKSKSHQLHYIHEYHYFHTCCSVLTSLKLTGLNLCCSFIKTKLNQFVHLILTPLFSPEISIDSDVCFKFWFEMSVRVWLIAFMILSTFIVFTS